MHERDFGLCGNCRGVCCGHEPGITVGIELTNMEAAFLDSAPGTLLFRLEAPLIDQLPDDLAAELLSHQIDTVRMVKGNPQITTPAHGRYLLKSCGHGVQDDSGRVVCTAYTNPRKPKICTSFQAGSPPCLEMRQAANIKDTAD